MSAESPNATPAVPQEIAPEAKESREGLSRQEYVNLAKELSSSPEGFPFAGITHDAYAKLKADTDEFPQYFPPLDALLERFLQHGMKVVLGKDPNSGNVFIVPGDSTDVQADNIAPEHLEIADAMDPRLKQLVLENRKLRGPR